MSNKSKLKKFHKLNRRIHLYAGLFMIPYIFIFGLSGLMFNHAAFMSENRSVETFHLEGDNQLNNLFPNINTFAASIADSIKNHNNINSFKLDNIKYSNTMILRYTNKEADHRVKIDIPTNNVEMIVLPDFVENNTVNRGVINAPKKLNTNDILQKVEKALENRGITSDRYRAQRIPNLEFDLTTNDNDYRVIYNLQSGDYRLIDLHQRKFKWNYFFVNLHQVHGYPVAGFSLEWLFVFFADSLAVLMIIWAISGLIMWYKMKRQFVIGLVLIGVSIIIALAIMINQLELGY